MGDYYILDGHTPVATDVRTWGEWFQDHEKRRVAQARWHTPTAIHVSTVFLGLDHSFGHGEPLLFETMIFAPALPVDQEQYRFIDWDSAIEAHRRIVTELTTVWGLPQESEER